MQMESVIKATRRGRHAAWIAGLMMLLMHKSAAEAAPAEAEAEAAPVAAAPVGQSKDARAAEPETAVAVAEEPAVEETAANKPSGQGASGSDLAQKLTNPVADLVSIPMQFNWRNGVGPNDELQMVLNIQPVVPIQVAPNWNLINRFILPVISQPALAPGDMPHSGLGDALVSLFASPVSSGKFQWGAGPVFGLPLTTDPALGTGQWSIGPTAVGLYSDKGWTLVLLANHLWSITETGDLDRANVSQTFVQPAVAFTTSRAMTFSLSSETSYNWKADDGEEATVPITAAVSQLTKFGPMPLSVQVGGGVYAEAPAGGPEWQLRLAFTVLLPTAKK